MFGEKICVLLVSLVLIISCNLKSSDLAKDGKGLENSFGKSVVVGPLYEVNRFVDEPFSPRVEYDTPAVRKGVEEMGMGIDIGDMDVELDNLLTRLNIQKEDRDVFVYLKKVLCDPTITDDQGVYKTYTVSEFHDLLDSWGAGQVSVIRSKLIRVFTSLKASRVLIGDCRNNILKQGLLNRLMFVKKEYERYLKKVFDSSDFSIIKVSLEYHNPYYGKFELIEIDASNFKDLTDVRDRYSAFVDDDQKGIQEIRNILTSANIARGQNLKTYSDDEFDILFSSWSNYQLKRVVRMHLGYMRRARDVKVQIGYFDNMKNIDATTELKDRLVTSLTTWKLKLEDTLSQKDSGYPEYLKQIFNKSTAVEIYDNIPFSSKYDINDYNFYFPFNDAYFLDIDRYYSIRNEFISKYNKLSYAEKVAVEFIRNIVFNANIAADKGYKTYTDDYKFYLIFASSDYYFSELVQRQMNFATCQSYIEEYINEIKENPVRKNKLLQKRDELVKKYHVSLKKFFHGVNEATFEFDDSSRKNYSEVWDIQLDFESFFDNIDVEGL
ncbi:BTA121 domain-containing protein surface lipoprotein [Borrelia duttonii]|uniref:Lipoprotein n=1 Tax=Borrelia duttonii (strain Ly) TaxID=412419 RepID=B5RNJ0_BORDL|nr:putative lipoprotein [Borrelia duttonii Ly]